LTLKGDCIWSLTDPTLYLDGNAFGVTRKDADGTNHIGLRLPQSGDGKRGGDFEMWFWLVLSPKVSALTFAPNPVNVGQSSNGTITLTGAAPAAGAAVALSSVALSSSGAQLPGVTIANLPAAVTVPPNQTSQQFPVTQTALPGNLTSAILRVTAAFGGSTVVQDLTINRPITVTALSFSPPSLLGGSGASTGTVTLSGPAPAGGAIVALATTTGNPAAAAVPQTVTVPAGQTTQTFQVPTTALQVNAPPVPVQVTASFGGATASAVLTVTAQRLA
jgi:hypothetical protein